MVVTDNFIGINCRGKKILKIGWCYRNSHQWSGAYVREIRIFNLSDLPQIHFEKLSWEDAVKATVNLNFIFKFPLAASSDYSSAHRFSVSSTSFTQFSGAVKRWNKWRLDCGRRFVSGKDAHSEGIKDRVDKTERQWRCMFVGIEETCLCI